MSSKQRAFLVVALIAVVAAVWYRSQALSPVAPPAQTPVDLVFVTGGSGPYWQIVANGARKAAEELDATVHIEMPSDAESLPEQTKILEKVDAAKTGGVAVSPLDAAGQTPLIDRLANDLFVVTFDSDAPDSKRKGYVGTSNFAAGRVCANLAREALPEGGKIAVILANTTKDNLQDRKGGFQETLVKFALTKSDDKAPQPPLEVVDFLIDDGSDVKCAELVAKAIADHPDLGCFVGMNARHGPVLRRVLKQEDKLGKIKIIAFDEADETLAGIENGDIYATVAQDPYRYGYEAVRMLCTLCRGDETQQPIGTTTLSVNVEKIRKDNLEAYRTKLKSRQTAAPAGK